MTHALLNEGLDKVSCRMRKSLIFIHESVINTKKVLNFIQSLLNEKKVIKFLTAFHTKF